MKWEIIGYTAACLTMFGFVPQVIKMFRTKHVKDVSILMLCQVGLGIFLWLLYGMHLRNSIIILANAVNLATIFVAIFCYCYYRRRNKALEVVKTQVRK
ncbi:hypothetical protein KDK77_02190 [bacterium]|nr:hypothetical protein [bacterium]MCP5462835.1 hypothetical protein [bacterium]